MTIVITKSKGSLRVLLGKLRAKGWVSREFFIQRENEFVWDNVKMINPEEGGCLLND